MSLCCREGGNCQVRNEESYTAGGARGEVEGGTAEETESTKGATSSRFAIGTRAILGDCAATTEPAVEQTGQRCEADGAAVKWVKKWNWAARKTTPRTNAKMRMR